MDMGDVLVIVIRYFGGIKLGAGGLVRAYAGAAESVLSAVDRVVQQPEIAVNAKLGFADEQPVRHWCEQNSARIEGVDYGAGVAMALAVPEVALEEFRAFCDARGLDYQMDNEAT